MIIFLAGLRTDVEQLGDCSILYFGFLNIDKPAGCTSRDVVNAVQRLVKPAKIGHAGTLDPLATGVLVVALGPATRLVEHVQRQRKSYRAEFLLGRTSDTEDVEGTVVELVEPPRPTLEQIQSAACGLAGNILQRPPAYSAIKVAGQRAYKLARRGEEVELQPRPITVYRFEVERYEYPALTAVIECSSGTYVRSLGRDLAERLGTGAVMSGLMRTVVGDFRIDDAISPDSLNRDNIQQHLQSPLLAVADLPSMQVDSTAAARIALGQFIEIPQIWATLSIGQEIAAVDESGKLISVLSLRHDGRLGAKLNFAAF